MKQGDNDSPVVAVGDIKGNAASVGDINVNPSVRDVSPSVSLSANGNALLSNKKSKSPEDNSVHVNIENHGNGQQTVSNVNSVNCRIL